MVRVHLSRLLGEKKWTQKELSRRTGIRENTINDLYHEFALGVKFEHLDKMCEALDCASSELIEYIPNKRK